MLPDNRIPKWLANMTEAYHALYGLIRDGKRSHQQISLLLDAMDLARHRRLGVVGPSGCTKSPEEVAAFCDRRIQDLGMPEDVVRVLHRSGIVIAGELFRFWWGAEWKVGAVVRECIANNGFPFSFDPWHAGWRPKYLQDVAVIKALNASVSTIGRRSSVWRPYPFFPCNSGHAIQEDWVVQRLAASFRKEHNDHFSACQRVQQEITEAGVVVLHAAMYLPEDQSQLAEKNPEHVEYLAISARAAAFRKAWGWPASSNKYGDNGVPERSAGYQPMTFTSREMERRVALVAFLQAEQLSPFCFFAVVLEHFGHATFDVLLKSSGVETIQSFLLLDQRSIGQEVCWEAKGFLRYWGIDFCKTPQDFEDIFGKQ